MHDTVKWVVLATPLVVVLVRRRIQTVVGEGRFDRVHRH